MTELLIAMAVLGGLGLGFGLILAVASRVFHVEADPRLEQLCEALPGANCGGCGYAGCAGYAEAVLRGEAGIGKCASGGDAAAEKMAAILGVTVEKVERKVAWVRCSGYKGTNENGNPTGAKLKGPYEGLKDCFAATKVAGRGPAICKYGCLGFGNCVAACKYGAISMVSGIAKVDESRCVGCMSCAAACPRGLIVPVEPGRRVTVPCASLARGAVTNRGCTAGCIACNACVKVCPKGAIRIERNLAVIDYEKCDGCGLCADACPKKLIQCHQPGW